VVRAPSTLQRPQFRASVGRGPPYGPSKRFHGPWLMSVTLVTDSVPGTCHSLEYGMTRHGLARPGCQYSVKLNLGPCLSDVFQATAVQSPLGEITISNDSRADSRLLCNPGSS
jgi:hypothetical protein